MALVVSETRDDAPDAPPWRHPSPDGGPDPWAYGCGSAREWPAWLRVARFAVLDGAGRAWWRAAFGVEGTEAWLRGENPPGYGVLRVPLVDPAERRKRRESVRLVVDHGAGVPLGVGR